jgi:ribosomal protein S10
MNTILYELKLKSFSVSQLTKTIKRLKLLNQSLQTLVSTPVKGISRAFSKPFSLQEKTLFFRIFKVVTLKYLLTFFNNINRFIVSIFLNESSSKNLFFFNTQMLKFISYHNNLFTTHLSTNAFKVIGLPSRGKKFTILRSPHVDKKSREQYELKKITTLVQFSMSSVISSNLIIPYLIMLCDEIGMSVKYKKLKMR